MAVWILVVLAAVALKSSNAAVCGTYSAPCGSFYNGSFFGADKFLGQIKFEGLWAGNYTWTRSIFSAAHPQCNVQPSLAIIMSGSWIDNQQDTTQTEALLYMTASTITVTPGDAATVAYLQTACPCGAANNWAVSTANVLSACSTGTCPDTTWLGGTPGSGISIGNPFYGVAYPPGFGATGPFMLSYIDANQTIGWQGKFPFSGNNYTGTGCIAPTTSNSICGTWSEYCSPSAYSAAPYYVGSLTASFSYEGPAPATQFQILAGDAGTYMLTENLFIDLDCSSPYITVSQQGVLAYFGVFTDSLGNTDWEYKRNTPNYQITPQTAGAVNYLVANCPCKDSYGNVQSWTIGVANVITTCPNNDCDGTLFLHSGSLGQPNFGGVQIYTSKSFSQIRLTELSNTTDLVNSFNNQNYPMVDNLYCSFTLAANRWCGNYARFCTASNRGDGYDFTESITFDAPNGNGVGSMTRNYQLFNTANNCGELSVASISIGQTYTVGKPAATAGGGYNFEVVSSSFTVIPQNASIVTMLNANCLCGGTWSIHVFRNIFGCTSCNVPFINTYELSGQPAYTNILVYPESLRYGNFSNVSSIGYATPIGITNFPLVKQNECQVPFSPTGSASKFPGGGVFLILLFVPLTIYFLVGSVLSYRSTGALSVPHKEFWTSLPGLVVSGLKFSFVEFFGLRGASPSGYTPQTGKPEGYGTLGE